MLKATQLEGKEKEVVSLEKLKKSCISKMRTIMIGAISDIEQISNIEIEEEQFENIRKSILDRGNNLIRCFEEELKQYTIVHKSNFTTFKREG